MSLVLPIDAVLPDIMAALTEAVAFAVARAY